MAATKTKPTGRNVYVPIMPFVAQVDGTDVNFTQYTYVREGHEILERMGHLFRQVHVQYDVEEATAWPGEQRT